MEIEKLIKIAKSCGNGSCDTKCKHFSRDGSSCRLFLIKDLAERLEKATSDIGKNCGTCKYYAKYHREPPCSICEPLKFDKWEWRGDAE